MLRLLKLPVAIVALAAILPPPVALDAAVRKPVPRRKAPARPVAPVAKPMAAVAAAPVLPGGFMTPKVVVLRNPTAAETEANAVWNVRAALNVAALQCQFSKFLRTVNNYNDMLKHHSDELSAAQTTMLGHFRRVEKARGPASFDQYTTRTYNSYSTLDAQYRFCDVAGWVGRRVLAVPKGQLRRIALTEAREVRAALAYQPLSPGLAVLPLAPVELPVLEPVDEIVTAQN